MANLRAVDLNLIVALDALIAERHVTRAANRLGLSQPAMSNALARLRTLFQDGLLVRTTAGMELTTRARELAAPIQQILRQTERILEAGRPFDAHESSLRFSMRMSDLLEVLLLPALLHRFYKHAPKAGMDVVHLSPEQTTDALEADKLDCAISTGLVHSRAIRAQRIFEDRMVCVMRRAHPVARTKMTMELFLGQRHVRVSISPTDTRFVDNVLTDLHLRRDIGLHIQHWSVLPQVLQTTDLLSVMSERLARTFSKGLLAVRELPFASTPIVWSAYWHRRHDHNPAQQWLRLQVFEAARQLG